MSAQQEFIFIEGRPDAPDSGPASSEAIVEEIRAAWRIPFLRQKVRVSLRGCPVDEMNGLLEIGDPAPDHPFDSSKPLHLRIDSIRFVHTQITACVLL